MIKEEIREGDIVEIDYIEEFTGIHRKKGKALVLWKGLNNQPLITLLEGEYSPKWSCYEYISKVIGHISLEEALEQQPCEDAISREDAIGALEYQLEITSDDGFEKYKPEIKQILNTIYDVQKKQIQALPSVTPIRPKGKWVEIVDEETAFSKTWHYECSKCGKNNTCLGGNPNFCPHCGADMRGKKE